MQAKHGGMPKMTAPIITIPKDGPKSVEFIRHVIDEAGIGGTAFAADFYIDGAETWNSHPGGWRHPVEPIISIDHHAPHLSMQRQVSSANLAIEVVAQGPGPGPDDAILISHMDCDSILAAGILSRRIEPNARYGEAALAADHTGEVNEIADLLQALDAHWSRTGRPMPDPDGLEYFFESLNRSEQDLSLDAFAKEALGQRQRSRDRAERAVLEGRIEYDQGIAFGVLDEPIEGELLLTCLPEAALVCTMNPHPVAPERWQVKIRLGLAAQGGRSLHQLRIVGFDPAYGGRWNAGSNNRGGGTDLSPDEYIQRLLTELGQKWG